MTPAICVFVNMAPNYKMHFFLQWKSYEYTVNILAKEFHSNNRYSLQLLLCT